MLFFLEEDIVQGEGSPLFRDAKMSKGNKVVLKSPADLDSEEAERNELSQHFLRQNFTLIPY